MWSDLSRVWNALKRQASAPIEAQEAALLSEEEIADLANSLTLWRSNGAWKERLSQALRQGRQTSRFRGSGMEYEESRPYQAGDELRHMNWRLMARTGEAFSKRFEETRQSQWWVLLDSRESMRFGTRKRLKVTQAARLAGILAWIAQNEGLRLNLLRLDQELAHLPTLFGRNLFPQTMAFANQACPASNRIRWPSLEAALDHLLPKLKGGDRLWILSDFFDLSEQNLQRFSALSQSLNLHALWLIDPVEKALPEIPGMRLRSSETIDFQIQTPDQLAAYRTWAKAYFSDGERALCQAGVEASFIETTAEVEALLPILLRQLEL
ncbi:DUF58 domain-containing protein [Thiomicrorhabdus sp.]|uniref:DUF58 domain-containing protein n=1 Tax=Thiomicrorhabdus sp. TaxID=2039724 RepID=UPI0029C9223C|nr:DUF58 domain-containing protein [Thiomicrorhabdus sp.]